MLTFLLVPSKSQGNQDTGIRGSGNGCGWCLRTGGSGLESRSGESSVRCPRVSRPESPPETMLILPLREVAKQGSPCLLQGDFKETTYKEEGDLHDGDRQGRQVGISQTLHLPVS